MFSRSGFGRDDPESAFGRSKAAFHRAVAAANPLSVAFTRAIPDQVMSEEAEFLIEDASRPVWEGPGVDPVVLASVQAALAIGTQESILITAYGQQAVAAARDGRQAGAAKAEIMAA